MKILSYSECSGGNHVTLTVEEDGKQRLVAYDKSELFSAPELDPVREQLKAAIAEVAPDAATKDAVDWTAVKAEVEQK